MEPFGSFETAIAESFSRQQFMRTLGAVLERVEDGRVEISCALTDGLKQQHGFFHAGALASVADSACGYAALTRMPAGSEVLSVEFKISLMKACRADRIVATGSVLKSGRTLSFCEGEVRSDDGSELFAKMTATMFRIAPSR